MMSLMSGSSPGPLLAPVFAPPPVSLVASLPARSESSARLVVSLAVLVSLRASVPFSVSACASVTVVQSATIASDRPFIVLDVACGL
jgi:hypothetical protein